MPKPDHESPLNLRFDEQGLPMLSEFPLEHFHRLPGWVLHLSQLPQAQRQQPIPYLQKGSVERNCGTCSFFETNTMDAMVLPDGRQLAYCGWNRSAVGSHNLCPSYVKGNPDDVD